MATVERGNVVLQIADEDIQRYLDKGYSVTDGKGNILQQTFALSAGELSHLLANRDAELAELKQQFEELKQQYAELTAYVDELEGLSEPVEEVVETPKRGRKKKAVE